VHSYPWVLVRADNKEEAKRACVDWIDAHIEDSAFDYGGPVDDGDDPECKTVIRYGEPDFMKVIKDAVKTEKAFIRENWSIVKQFVLKFAACKNPPPDSRKCNITRVVTHGIGGLIKSGEELTYDMSVHEGFLRMKWLDEMRKHMEYRRYMSTSDACLFEDADVDIDELLAGKSVTKDPKKLFLVQMDCHH